MLYLSIIFLLHVVAVVTSSDSCLIQTCSASQNGDIAAALYDTSIPYAGGDDDAASIANFLTLNCGLSPQITQCYVDCNGIYGGNGAYWTVQNCLSQCGIGVDCFGIGYYAWFCSTAVSNVCQLATPSAPTSNPTATGQATGTAKMESQAQDEFKCYALPYGALGFVSHIIMLYNVVCLLNLRKTCFPCSKTTPSKHSCWNMAVACAVLGGTTTLTIITIVRCKNHWRYILLAVEQLSLSITISLLGLSASTANEDSHRSNSYIIYIWLTIPGSVAGAVGYFALLAQNWSNHNVRIAFASTIAVGIVINTIVIFFAPMAPHGTNPLSFLIFMYLTVVAFDDWIFGIIAKNIAGKPTGPVAHLILLYFGIRRIALIY